MKIALYVEDGLEQIVLTPDTKAEASILEKIHDGSRTLSIHRGAFYGCRGGWVRWKERSTPSLYSSLTNRDDDESTIVVLRRAETVAPEEDMTEATDDNTVGNGS